MAFSFGFTTDDFSDDELDQTHSAPPAAPSGPNPLDTVEVPEPNEPKLHSLDSILASLENVRITFDNYTTPKNNIVYRRELFDIKHQVMMEENDGGNAVSSILVGGTKNETDLQKNVYEGGFKSWECSYDTVDKLSSMIPNFSFSSFLELGCGTSLPTCFLLLQKLQNKWTSSNPIEFILSDFNYEVLRLVTVPNLLIHWASTVDPKRLFELSNVDGTPLQNDELLITPALIQEFKKGLEDSSITLTFVSGAWSRRFVDLVRPADLIISSETIYSTEISPVVAETISALMKKEALVAAKNIYFGVGGSVVEFVNYVKSIGLETEVEEVDSQLKRSLVKITK